MPPVETGEGLGLVQAQVNLAVEKAKATPVRLRGNALKAVVAWAACRGLDEAAEKVYLESQVEVPEAYEHDFVRHPMTLAMSGRHPGTDPELGAAPYKPAATVVYDSEYAMAQHEGEMTYERKGNTVSWEVFNHTKPGSKTKYLEDPLKAVIPELEAIVGASVAAALEEFKVV